MDNNIYGKPYIAQGFSCGSKDHFKIEHDTLTPRLALLTKLQQENVCLLYQ